MNKLFIQSGGASEARERAPREKEFEVHPSPQLALQRGRLEAPCGARGVHQKRCARVRGGKTGNDPSAGSPTETLLRLLLPLNDKVWTASRGIVAGEPASLSQSGGLTGSFNR